MKFDLDIPPDAAPAMLRSFAKMLREMAAMYERAADIREDALGLAADTRAALDSYRAAGEQALKRIAAGEDRDAVIADIAAGSGIFPGTVAVHLRWAERRAEQEARARRDRYFLQLVAKGWTNAQIGRRFGVHPKTVQRAISLARRQR